VQSEQCKERALFRSAQTDDRVVGRHFQRAQ
jgi:hypothetical protein